MQVGQLIRDRYEIEAMLGSGSYGAVYKARNRDDGSATALKVLRTSAADPQAGHRFRREAKLVSHLQSPNTIRIHEYFETDKGELVIAMEYLEGRLLADVLDESKKLPPERAERIARGVLASLVEAHRAGIVHRDLNPRNVFLQTGRDGYDQVKVFDFGIAKIVGGGSAGLKESIQLTQAGGTLGTPQYMSPEQCRGESLSPASDIYALGIVLYECLTGDVPFDHPRPAEILVMHSIREVPPMPAELAELPIARAVMMALRKNVDSRILSAEQFLTMLDADEVEDPGEDPDLARIQAEARAREDESLASSGYAAPGPARPGASSAWMVMLLVVLAGLLGYAVMR